MPLEGEFYAPEVGYGSDRGAGGRVGGQRGEQRPASVSGPSVERPSRRRRPRRGSGDVLPRRDHRSQRRYDSFCRSLRVGAAHGHVYTGWWGRPSSIRGAPAPGHDQPPGLLPFVWRYWHTELRPVEVLQQRVSVPERALQWERYRRRLIFDAGDVHLLLSTPQRR